MITKIPRGELRWFQQWIERDEIVPPSTGARQVVILHPGTRWVPDHQLPTALPYANDPDDARLSARQQLILEEALHTVLDPRTVCHFALYAGFLNESDHGRSDGFNEPAATWHSGRLNYVLFSGELRDSGFVGVEQRWGSGRTYIAGAPFPIVELSYLWTDDHTVMVASPPDTAATFVLGPGALAELILNDSELDAREWSRGDSAG
ncbi:MAG: hypothetical protein EOO67_03355 [Microbacterium sp.]|nr:MAG: hypothetical protein EOO67_03355 [Microbacterium sp.]